ncbi:MAG: DUF6165 family protein [Gammaproteobacteria bacterium]
MNIKIEVSCGELIDKLTILRIKEQRITDAAKLANVRLELGSLEEAWRNAVQDESLVSQLVLDLQVINERLWEIEDQLREREATKRFDGDFLELARQVYITNDQRARIKREINVKLGSDFVEEKHYNRY